MTSDEHPSTEELRAIQVDRVDAERQMAGEAADRAEEAKHDRRAERAEYLADKLDDQAEALDQ